jgi:hypothetical protein
MELQQENMNLRREKADLESRIVDLKLRLKDDKKSDTASIEQEMKADVGRAAKFFHVFMSPVITVDAFKMENPPFLYDSPERYDEGQEKYGIATDLHHLIPPKYLAYLGKHESLAKEVRSLVSDLALIKFFFSVLDVPIQRALFCSRPVSKPRWPGIPTSG